jgi:hypothetical protein
MALDSSKDKSSWGGARQGAGRPQGSMNAETKERLEVKKAYQDRIAQHADRLFNSQFNLAVGEQYLMWRHKVGSGVKERMVTEVVDDPKIIKAFLDEELDTTDGDFYFISTKPANGAAIDSMLDRSFGKADSKVENTGQQKLIIETRKRGGNTN